MLKNSRGFTIVELLIVIIVIAILAAISVTAYNGISERSRLNSASSFTKQLERNYAQNRVINMTFEDGLGNGSSPMPTEDSGSNISKSVDPLIKTIANTDLPNSKFVYDFSQSGGSQQLVRLYPSPYPSGSYVMSYWFKHQASTTNWDGHTLTCYDCGTSQQTVWQTGSSNSGYRVDYNPRYGSGSVVLTSKPYDLSKWHHFALQYDEASKLIRLYMDGVKQDEKTTVSVAYNGGVYMDIGRGVGGPLFGQIDDFKLYSY